MNVLIAAMPRSGSTLLASLLTKPPERLVFHEGSLTQDNAALRRSQRQLEPFGAPKFWSKVRLVEWADGHIPFWGTKEVRASFIWDAVKQLRPRKIVLLIRNPWHAALSMRERQLRLGHRNLLGKRAGAFAQVASEIEKLTRMDNAFLLRYEDLVSRDPAWRNGLSWWLGVPLDGDPRSCLRVEPRDREELSREYEVRRHGGQMSDASIAMREAEVDPEALAYADSVAERCRWVVKVGRYKKPDALAPGPGPKVHP